MDVIDFRPQFWYFLRQGDDYFIDVNCSRSSVGFNRLVKLTDEETDSYEKGGKDYLDALAHDIQYFALSQYNDMHLTGKIEKEVYAAIMRFLGEDGRG